MHTSKGKKAKGFICYSPSSGNVWQLLACEAGLQHTPWLLQKANVVNNKCLQFLLFVAVIYELTSFGMEYSFGKFGLLS